MFFKFDENMRKIFNQDISTFLVLSFIKFNTNHQKGEYKGLKTYQCYISQRLISEITGIPQPKVCKKLKELEEQGFISYVYKSKSKHKPSIVFADFISKSESVNESVSESVNESVNESVQSIENTKTKARSKSVNESVSESLSRNLSKNLSRNISNIYSRVITRLNEKTNKNFKANTKKTIACIDARLKEGFTEDDFYKVIDIKSKTWLHDPEMNKYLRPQTLFGNKFESYLNENYEEPPKEQAGKFVPHYKVGVRVNETFRQYEPDELERLLRESQKGKFN